MTAQLTIRDATPDDIADITAIYAPSVTDGTASFELEPPDEAEMARRMQAIVGAGYPYLIAELGGDVVGYAYASAYRTRPAYRWSVENTVYISPMTQRTGAGRSLLQALIAACVAKGYRQMIAVIGDSGHSASIGLHRALGFTFCGTIHSVGYKHSRWLDSVIMQRQLGPGDTSPPV